MYLRCHVCVGTVALHVLKVVPLVGIAPFLPFALDRSTKYSEEVQSELQSAAVGQCACFAAAVSHSPWSGEWSGRSWC